LVVSVTVSAAPSTFRPEPSATIRGTSVSANAPTNSTVHGPFCGPVTFTLPTPMEGRASNAAFRSLPRALNGSEPVTSPSKSSVKVPPVTPKGNAMRCFSLGTAEAM